MVNTSSGIVLLKAPRDALVDYRISLIKVNNIVVKKRWKNLDFLLRLRNYEPSEDQFPLILNALFALCISGRHKPENEAEKYLLSVLDTGSMSIHARKNVQFWIKLFFLQLYKSGALLLGYKFTRPQSKWVDNLPSEYSCYTEVVSALRAMDTKSYTSANSPLDYDAAEVKNRRIFQLATKIALASQWHQPEQISVEDFLAWRDAEVTSAYRGDSLISPLPLVEIAMELEQTFGTRIGFTARQVKEAIFGVGKRRLSTAIIERKETNFLLEYFSIEDPLELVTKILASTGLPAGAFCHETVDKLSLAQCLATKGINIDSSIESWNGFQREYLDLMNYEQPRSWETVFGLLNCYLFIYLAVWFKINPLVDLIYPCEPNKFLSKHFYKRKAGATLLSPLTFIEFYDAVGYKFNYLAASNLKLFFKYLIDYKFDDSTCRGLIQPVTWLPKSKKSSVTTKHVFAEAESKLYAEFLDAVSSAADALDRYVKVLQHKYSSHEISEVNFEDIGYIPFVTVDGKHHPIYTFDRRSLIVMKVDGVLHYNPATTVIPYCLVRGGLRGQNLQWLDSTNYALHVERDLDEPLGVSLLYINTDKIRKEPFTVYCRYEVIRQLDLQWKWRQRIKAEVKVPGFDMTYPYEGNVDSKWGLISCLFANDPDRGAPVTDRAYQDAVLYSQLSFQQWMRENDLGALQLVAFIGVPLGGNNRDAGYFTWDQWYRKKLSGLNVKVATEELGNGEVATYCPITLRAKITSHGGRATHITQLLKHLSPEDVAKTTGQTATTALHYDKGNNDFRRRFAGVINNQDPAKQLLQGTQNSNLYDQISKLLGSSDARSIAAKLGFFNLSDKTTVPDGQLDGLEIIVRESSAQLGECATHLCAVNFICPGWVLVMFDGARVCPWCPLSIYHTDSIFAVAARRHQLAEDLERIQMAFSESTMSASNGERKILEARLKQLADELLGWYYVERTMDALIFRKASNGEISSYAVIKKGDVVRHVSRHVVQKGSSEQFMRRLDEVCEFPNTISEAFREKVARATRMILARRGEVYQAILQPLKPNPELHLVALIKESTNEQDFDMEKFVKLVNMTSFEWIEKLAQERRISSDDSKDNFGIF